MPRPQFSIRTLFWLTLVVAAFLGGMLFGEHQAKRRYEESLPGPYFSPYQASDLGPLNSY